MGNMGIIYAFTYSKMYPFSEDHLKQWNSRKSSTDDTTSSDVATPPKRQHREDEENSQE